MYGYLLQLQTLRLMNALQTEQIIEKCFLMGVGKISVDDLKIIAAQFLLGKEPGTFDTDAVYYPGNDIIN